MATEAEIEALRDAIIEDARIGVKSFTVDGTTTVALTPAERLAVLEAEEIAVPDEVPAHTSFGMRHRVLSSPGGWGRG
jgi:hypothetical protein